MFGLCAVIYLVIFYILIPVKSCCFAQMQSTIREHRDGGNAGGVFSRYNIIKVCFILFFLYKH